MYNFLITAMKDAWQGSTYTFSDSRVFNGTEAAVKARFEKLGAAERAGLMALPTLFAYEKDTGGDARVGFIKAIDTRSREIRVTFEVDPRIEPITPEKLADLSWELGLEDWERNTTHWAVKDVDLMDAINDVLRRQKQQQAPPYTLPGIAALPSPVPRPGDPVVPTDAGTRHAGQTVGFTFELSDSIGSGSYGEVWKARRGQDTVAVKFAKELAKGSLRKEALCLARIEHPSFPKFIAYSSDPEFIVMSLVSGVTAKAWLEKKPQWGSRLTVIYRLCVAIHHLHSSLNMFHRDLKLENFLVDSNDHVGVLDLGLAKTDLTEEQTRDPRWVANIRNAAPESLNHILRRRRGPVTFRGPQEVWALGCIAWHLLEGRHPFDKENELMSTIANISDGAVPPSPSSFPNEIADLVQSMLAHDPKQRPPMEEVVAVFGALSGHESAKVSDGTAGVRPTTQRQPRATRKQPRAKAPTASLIVSVTETGEAPITGNADRFTLEVRFRNETMSPISLLPIVICYERGEAAPDHIPAPLVTYCNLRKRRINMSR